MLGNRLISMPFSDYCDPLVTTEGQWSELITSLCEQGSPIVIRPLHDSIARRDPRFAETKKARWHRIDITPDLEGIWQRNDESTRRAIKKAQRDKVEVAYRQDIEAMRAYYDMHLAVRKYKYGMLAQPWTFFEAIFERWMAPKNGGILLASVDGSVIAGTLVLRWQDTLYYKFNASARNQLGARPNDIIVWELIKLAKAQGCAWVDLGLSDWDQEGLIRFKQKYATEDGTISFLRFEPAEYVPTPSEAQIKSLFGALTGLFVDGQVSDVVTEKAGNLLYRYFV